MLITGPAGPAANLRPLRWEFPPDAEDGDNRWLDIGGTVDLGDRSWTFTEPCLLIAEAHELTEWLRDCAASRIERDPPSSPGALEPSLSFLEPNLGFSIAERDNGELTVRIYFTAESAPPWLRNDDPQQAYNARCIVDLRLRTDQLLTAADDWAQELNALPPRSWPDPD